jgi:hypothetical protein
MAEKTIICHGDKGPFGATVPQPLGYDPIESLAVDTKGLKDES